MVPYKQIALTDFNPDYKIRSDRQSGKRYDRGFMKNDKKFDERAYSLLKPNLPNYLNKVITSFGKNVTRVCIAITEPGGGIAPHRDYDTFSTRYHIAIKTNQKATMNDIHVPADGYVWFINSGKIIGLRMKVLNLAYINCNGFGETGCDWLIYNWHFKAFKR